MGDRFFNSLIVEIVESPPPRLPLRLMRFIKFTNLYYIPKINWYVAASILKKEKQNKVHEVCCVERVHHIAVLHFCYGFLKRIIAFHKLSIFRHKIESKWYYLYYIIIHMIRHSVVSFFVIVVVNTLFVVVVVVSQIVHLSCKKRVTCLRLYYSIIGR